MSRRRGHSQRTSTRSDAVLIPTSRHRACHSPVSRRCALGLGLARRYRQPPSVSSSSHVSSASPPESVDSRRVLAPLQFNLRRLPSRLAIVEKESMHVSKTTGSIQIGSKRKRVVSGAENASGVYSRSKNRSKRRRGSFGSVTTDDDTANTMDIDQSAFGASDNSDTDGDTLESTYGYFITEAPERHLLRLRKDYLLELYRMAGLADDTDVLTKQDIVDAIISARDDEEFASLPPSSPRDRDGGSSEYSSDDGNVAGGEETDVGPRFSPESNCLRRRVTVHDVSRISARPMKGRTFSLGQLEQPTNTRHKPGHENDSSTLFPRIRRRTGSARSSPTTSTGSSSLPSPPATRLRSRKLSNEVQSQVSSVNSQRPRGKSKEVQFVEHVEVALPGGTELSELSELTESDVDTVTVTTNPSPRRLRSQGGTRRNQTADEPRSPIHSPPQRKGKECITYDNDDEQEEDELDELTPSNPTTPRPTQVLRTPVKRRLRPRKLQTYTPPSDGDDECEEANEDEITVDGAEGDDEDAEGETDGEADDDDATLVEPRKLRSGRVVGEKETISDDEEEEVQEDMSVDEEVDLDGDGSVIEDEDEDEEEDEGSEYDDSIEDVDLSTSTSKSLVRLRRDDLVRLCEARQLSVDGTKAQLADALIRWWQTREVEVSAPSSSATARPPSTARPRITGRRKRSSKTETPPVLLRSHYIHEDEPRTPPLSSGQQKDEDLELDLESLGLEDREIPPEKLLKLDKIGSGGFKDVFTGKFKGRKVAISEFRGQLNAMDIKELKLLGGFDHPNIVRFLGVCIPPEESRSTPVMIVSELCTNGDLFDYIRNVPPPSLYRVLNIMLDIARGLEYLHLRKPSVIHRDCKSSNILITSKGVAKIADFGLAKVKQSTRSMVRSLVGTVNWQAPELWHPHPKYNHKVDVYACAMVYWEMLQWHAKDKRYPWEGMNEHAIYDAVGAKRQRPSLSGLRKLWCHEVIDLVERMWAQEHQDRPTMSEVVTDLENIIPKYR